MFMAGSTVDLESKLWLSASAAVPVNTCCRVDETIESVAQWFLNKASMSNKKLQKLCYYAYCWFIVFFNDIEDNEDRTSSLKVLSAEKFQAWIHGPVCPSLYRRYKDYGWSDVPSCKVKPEFKGEIQSLLEQVWDAYGAFSADELEMLSHTEPPWINARKGCAPSEPCTREIDDHDILQYYSALE